MASYYVADGFGGSIEEPTPEQMRAFIDALDASDEEHGAAWLSTEDEHSLEWNGDGRLVYTMPDSAGGRHLRDVTRERAVELWCALARGDLEYIERQPWKEGGGFELTPEREEVIRTSLLAWDREFYDSLGLERADEACRREGCSRGAIEHSVLCRVHHFESVRNRPCPFDD